MHGSNVYPGVNTPMPPMPAAGGFVTPSRIGVNIYPTVPIPLHPDGVNLYQYVRSNPVNRLDPSGLQSMPASAPAKPQEGEFKITDLGKRNPKQDGPVAERTGATRVDYCPNGRVKTTVNPKTACHTLVFVDFYGTAKYWWSSEKSKKHEEMHVSQGKAHWDAFYEYAKGLKNGGEYPTPLAKCWMEAIEARRIAEYAAYYAEGKKMDADRYADIVPEVAQEAKRAADDAAAKMKAFQKVHKKCSGMLKPS